MGWKTVPNFFPDYEELDNNDKYNLFEGYGVSHYKTKWSGRHYKKVSTDIGESVDNVLMYLNYDNWHLEWKLESYCFGLFRRWSKREK